MPSHLHPQFHGVITMCSTFYMTHVCLIFVENLLLITAFNESLQHRKKIKAIVIFGKTNILYLSSI